MDNHSKTHLFINKNCLFFVIPQELVFLKLHLSVQLNPVGF